MAGIQRMIKSGIRLFNYNPRAINFAASPINRLGSSANSYRWLCSSSCGDGHSNVKRTFNVDTCAMVKALKAEGIPLKKAETITNSITEILAELEKNPAHPCSTLLKSNIESLQKNINFGEGAQEIKFGKVRCNIGAQETSKDEILLASVPVVGIIAVTSIIWKMLDNMHY